MKTIYNAILKRIEEKVPEIKWVDLDCGQLETKERPPVVFPCCLISIEISDAESITDTIQNCKAKIGIRLAFDHVGRTALNTTVAERNKSLQIYDTIADVYKALQGFGTDKFDCMDRKPHKTKKKAA